MSKNNLVEAYAFYIAKQQDELSRSSTNTVDLSEKKHMIISAARKGSANPERILNNHFDINGNPPKDHAVLRHEIHGDLTDNGWRLSSMKKNLHHYTHKDFPGKVVTLTFPTGNRNNIHWQHVENATVHNKLNEEYMVEDEELLEQLAELEAR